MKILLLSCDSIESFVVADENLAINELKKRGHHVKTLSWTADYEWSEFDCVIIRTTWDYVEKYQEFINKLESISKKTKLFNPLETIKWNINKNYLKIFQDAEVEIVPTLFFTDNEDVKIPDTWDCEKVVIKPAVSAGSHKTTVCTLQEIRNGDYKNEISPGDWLCQPFLPQIAEGEYSLIYFNKSFSHGLLKVPKKGEFRVQEEFGGDVIPVDINEELLSIGNRVIDLIKDELLYARVDLIPFGNTYALMEIEVIEPALYFRTNPIAAINFADAIERLKN
jgi:glutathione synthase/RimK-type ligase-like ATP-grasp enzyme